MIEHDGLAKALKRKHKLYEAPISYYGRDFSEGKKITWRYGFAAIWALMKVQLHGLSE